MLFMKFTIDRQTTRDLQLFDSKKDHQSIFDFFCRVRSIGGRLKLHTFLAKPLTDLEELTARQEAIHFISKTDLSNELQIDKSTLDFIEHYLKQEDYPTHPQSWIRTIEKAFWNKLTPDNKYYIVERGVDYVVDVLNYLRAFHTKMLGLGCPTLIQENANKLLDLFSHPEFEKIKIIKDMQKIKALDIAYFDYLFRYKYRDSIRWVLDTIYEYDVFITVASIAHNHGFAYPEMLSGEKPVFELEGFVHPLIQNPVANNIHLSSTQNMLFLTGTNMSGKSSALRSMALCAYLAHVGFPIPAKRARISLLSGIVTTINLSDDISLGYSHFYSEVKRIKQVVECLKTHKNMLVVFDELFRGTNVKDAFDGTLAILTAFSKVKGSFFMVSTHIQEVADELSRMDSIAFRHLEISINNGEPQYTHQLKNGVSAQRLGMYIINKENIIDEINSLK